MRKCSQCNTAAARYRVRNAYLKSANGKVVCSSNLCWRWLTGGYPAEGIQITDKEGSR